MERRQTQIIPGTDVNLVGEIENQYYQILKILIDPELQPLKSRITMLYASLGQHLESQQNHIRKCKMNKADIDNFVSRIASCHKIIEDQTIHADNIKKDLQKLQHQTQELKKKQNDVKDTITRHRLQMNILQKQSIKGLQQIQIKQENQQNQLKKKLDEQLKIKEQLQTKQISLLNQQKYGMDEISELQKQNSDIMSRIDDLREKIKEIQTRDTRQKRNNDQKKQQLNKAKRDKDSLKEQKKIIDQSIKSLDKQIAQTAQTLRIAKKSKDDEHRQRKKAEKEKESLDKEEIRRQDQKVKLQNQKTQKLQELQKQKIQYEQLLIEKDNSQAQKKMISKKLNEIKTQNQDLGRKKQSVLGIRQTQSKHLENLMAMREKFKSVISSLTTAKMEKDKTCKVNQKQEHQFYEQTIQEENKYKKIKNQCASYQVEEERLQRILEQIKKEQEKYGIEASHAHSKYYQILQELRLKNTQIQNLQRQNQQVQNKCKHQQNLYEAVRSDRNLYSKDFIRSKQQINDLKKKYKRMTFQVEQLRDQIKAKDQELVELDKQFKKVESQNVKIKADKNRAKAQIQSTQEVIKNQQNHIGHLKKIIQQAKQQKAKQQKDYDMVRNERDILGTQLIKRNQQLAILYEKIKLSNSNLTKGEIYYKEKQKQFNNFRTNLANLKNESVSIQAKIQCIGQLKAQISYKEKDLLNQKAKIKALEDQLQNPMNVHRWRKLQATDQDNYQRILKIQTLQRRLIAKTQEVEAKENLIRQKQKLFLELKNILARQPGSEIHEQLIKYRDALKQKTGQMKKMKKELEDAHQQMERARYQVDRIRGQMAKMKSEYFQLREASQKQVMDERNFAQQMMNLNNNQADKMGMEINAMKK